MGEERNNKRHGLNWSRRNIRSHFSHGEKLHVVEFEGPSGRHWVQEAKPPTDTAV